MIPIIQRFIAKFNFKSTRVNSPNYRAKHYGDGDIIQEHTAIHNHHESPETKHKIEQLQRDADVQQAINNISNRRNFK